VERKQDEAARVENGDILEADKQTRGQQRDQKEALRIRRWNCPASTGK
jgi:hypothetical protein